MGICIFFYQYARFTGKKLHSKYAGELLDEIYNEIDLNYPVNFSDGLAGIAWGVEYLIRNRFVDADPDELLEDLDRQIVKQDIRKTTDLSLEKGLKGLAYYVIARYGTKRQISPVISMQYVYELFTSLSNNGCGDMEVEKLMFQLKNILANKELTINLDNLLFEIIHRKRISSNELFKKKLPLGLYGGYAGVGLSILNQS